MGYISISFINCILFNSICGSKLLIIIIGLSLYGFSLLFSGASLIKFTLFSVNIPKGTTFALMWLRWALINALGNQIISWSYFQSEM